MAPELGNVLLITRRGNECVDKTESSGMDRTSTFFSLPGKRVAKESYVQTPGVA